MLLAKHAHWKLKLTWSPESASKLSLALKSLLSLSPFPSESQSYSQLCQYNQTRSIKNIIQYPHQQGFQSYSEKSTKIHSAKMTDADSKKPQLAFSDYDAIGFDLDHTLAKYNIPRLFNVRKKYVHPYYMCEILEMKY